MKCWIAKLRVRLPAFFLLVITVLFWAVYDRYEVADSVLLSPTAFKAETIYSGDAAESLGVYRCSVSPGGKKALIRFVVNDALSYKKIRVKGRVRFKDVVAGKESWECARFLFIQRNAKKQWVSRFYQIMAGWGASGWRRYEKVFEIDSSAESAEVWLQQCGGSGSIFLDHLLVEPVRVKTSCFFWRIAFLVGWVLAAVCYFSRCRLHCRPLRWLIFINAVAILIGTLIPSERLDEMALRASEFCNTIHDKVVEGGEAGKSNVRAASLNNATPVDNGPVFSQKSIAAFLHHGGHFLLFASLCFWVYCSAALEQQHPIYFVKVCVDVLLFAAITEALQLLTYDRTASIADLMFDFCGMVLAITIFSFVLFLLKSLQRVSGLYKQT